MIGDRDGRRCRSTVAAVGVLRRGRRRHLPGRRPRSPGFVRFGERRFHRILKAKFGLSDR